jgi:hypothetical protein
VLSSEAELVRWIPGRHVTARRFSVWDVRVGAAVGREGWPEEDGEREEGETHDVLGEGVRCLVRRELGMRLL